MSWHGALQGPLTCLVNCFWMSRDTRTPSCAGLGVEVPLTPHWRKPRFICTLLDFPSTVSGHLLFLRARPFKWSKPTWRRSRWVRPRLRTTTGTMDFSTSTRPRRRSQTRGGTWRSVAALYLTSSPALLLIVSIESVFTVGYSKSPAISKENTLFLAFFSSFNTADTVVYCNLVILQKF